MEPQKNSSPTSSAAGEEPSLSPRQASEMAERRRMLKGASELDRRARDLGKPLHAVPAPVKSFWSQEELASAEFPKPDGPIPGLIPDGLTLLAGRSSYGKSWLMLQLGCALAAGGKFLERDLHLGRVLYYALEDGPGRLKLRTARLGVVSYALIEFVLAIQPLHLGGLAAVEAAAKYGRYRMIIIDTLQRAMPGKDLKKDAALFQDIFSQLQRLARQNALAIVASLPIRGTPAGYYRDPDEDGLALPGSRGLTIPADCVVTLHPGKGRLGTILRVRGRDLDDIDLAIRLDPATCAWQLRECNE